MVRMPILKKTVMIKKISEDKFYAIDISQDEDKIYKFQGPSAYFINSINQNQTFEELMQSLKKDFENIDEAKIKEDFNDFFLHLKKYQLVE